MRIWEYSVLVDESPLENALGEHGKMGWELVSAFYDGLRYIYYFKRPKE